MTNLFLHSSLQPTAMPTPLVRLLVWLAALAFAAGLSFLRVATDAEFAFASAVILPVVAVAWFEQVSDDFSEMVKAADDLMYEIKKDGKHGVRSKKFTMD